MDLVGRINEVLEDLEGSEFPNYMAKASAILSEIKDFVKGCVLFFDSPRKYFHICEIKGSEAIEKRIRGVVTEVKSVGVSLVVAHVDVARRYRVSPNRLGTAISIVYESLRQKYNVIPVEYNTVWIELLRDDNVGIYLDVVIEDKD